jgi:uncharacterized protein (TIGR00251 family)
VGRIAVVVAPGAARTELVGRHGEAWKVRVAAAPERGRANAALVEWLADTLGVPRDDVSLVGGGSSRRKLVDVAGMNPDEIERQLAG